jgi:hypothetical protein
LECHKNKVEEGGVFLATAQGQFSHHVYHAFHHVLTIKKPRSTTAFCKTPLKKHSKNANAPDLSGANFL